MRDIRLILSVDHQWTGQLILDDFAGLYSADADSRVRHPTTFTDTVPIPAWEILLCLFISLSISFIGFQSSRFWWMKMAK